MDINTYLLHTELTASLVFGVESYDAIGFVVERTWNASAVETLRVLVICDFVSGLAATIVHFVLVDCAGPTELYWASLALVILSW